jgi:hypothetical protein
MTLAEVFRVHASRHRRGADQVGEHHRDLAAFSAVFGRGVRNRGRCRYVSGRRLGGPISTQRSNGIQQLHTVPKRRDTQLLQVLVRQARENRLIYVILAEDHLVLPEAQAPQPNHDVHDEVLSCARSLSSSDRPGEGYGPLSSAFIAPSANNLLIRFLRLTPPSAGRHCWPERRTVPAYRGACPDTPTGYHQPSSARARAHSERKYRRGTKSGAHRLCDQ